MGTLPPFSVYTGIHVSYYSNGLFHSPLLPSAISARLVKLKQQPNQLELDHSALSSLSQREEGEGERGCSLSHDYYNFVNSSSSSSDTTIPHPPLPPSDWLAVGLAGGRRYSDSGLGGSTISHDNYQQQQQQQQEDSLDWLGNTIVGSIGEDYDGRQSWEWEGNSIDSGCSFVDGLSAITGTNGTGRFPAWEPPIVLEGAALRNHSAATFSTLPISMEGSYGRRGGQMLNTNGGSGDVDTLLNGVAGKMGRRVAPTTYRDAYVRHPLHHYRNYHPLLHMERLSPYVITSPASNVRMATNNFLSPDTIEGTTNTTYQADYQPLPFIASSRWLTTPATTNGKNNKWRRNSFGDSSFSRGIYSSDYPDLYSGRILRDQIPINSISRSTYVNHYHSGAHPNNGDFDPEGPTTAPNTWRRNRERRRMAEWDAIRERQLLYPFRAKPASRTDYSDFILMVTRVPGRNKEEAEEKETFALKSCPAEKLLDEGLPWEIGGRKGEDGHLYFKTSRVK